jgi:hypothetical protein
MNEQGGCEALEALNDKIGDLAELVRAIKARAREYAERVQELDEELAAAMAEGRDSDLSRIIRRRLIPVSALGRLGNCLSRAALELDKHEQVEEDRLHELETYAPADLDRRATA